MIQDYHCSIWRTAVYVQGRIWLTQNYVLFQGLGIQEVMPYRKMIEIKKERTQLVLEGLSIALGPDKTVSLLLSSFFFWVSHGSVGVL